MRRLLNNTRSFLQRTEPWIFVVALVVVLGIWGFAEITDEVMEGDTATFDQSILRSLRDPADHKKIIGPGWLLTVVRDITALGSGLVMLLVIGSTTGFLLLVRRYQTVVFLLIATVGATLLNVAMKHLIGRPRPEIVPHLTDVSSASFPSGHAAMSAAVYLTIGAILAQSVKRRRLKLYFVGLAIILTGMVGLSRVVLGVHYPSDVLAGWSSGLVWALLCWLVARYLQRHGAIEKESDALPGAQANPPASSPSP